MSWPHATEPRSGVSTGLPEVASVYQPVVDLRTGAVVGYEALVRGPAGTPLESPAALFARARELGIEAQLDLQARGVALRGALERGLPSSMPLFVNAEPRWLAEPWPAYWEPTLERARDRLQIVVEVTERALVDDPARLLRAVDGLRADGAGVALDDVGADPASLALMPFLEPDVIKLDLRLVQHYEARDVAAVVAAVNAQAERSGAVVLAEGIETEAHRSTALAMGATLGQGWLLGRPGPLPSRHAVPRHDIAFTRALRPAPDSPFGCVTRSRTARQVTKELLLPMSHHLEQQALNAPAPVLLAAFEDATHFTPRTVERYARLGEHCGLVVAIGRDMPSSPVPGHPAVRGGRLDAGDPLLSEWVVCLVDPHVAGALVARDVGDAGPDRQRRFDTVVTYDRDLVVDVARSLIAHVEPFRH